MGMLHAIKDGKASGAYQKVALSTIEKFGAVSSYFQHEHRSCGRRLDPDEHHCGPVGK